MDLNKPSTMREVLSTIALVFDPLNFAAQVMCLALTDNANSVPLKIPMGPNRSVGPNSDKMSEIKQQFAYLGEKRCSSMLLQLSGYWRCWPAAALLLWRLWDWLWNCVLPTAECAFVIREVTQCTQITMTFWHQVISWMLPPLNIPPNVVDEKNNFSRKR